MTDISEADEREAREWLESWKHSRAATSVQNARTILALLDKPGMPKPEDVPASVMIPIADLFGVPYAEFRALYRALYDHYTAPPAPAKVELWALVQPCGKIVANGSREYILKWSGHKDYSGSRIVRLREVEADHD